MIQNPEYGIDIIVLIKYHEQYSWYLSDKTYWVLDYIKWGSSFGSVDEREIISEREGLSILDTENWLVFAERISNLKLTKAQLSELILRNRPIVSWDEKGELFPSLFIDFDEKKLFSLFPEYLSFEEFVPNRWEGKYDDFYNLIPESEKYWIVSGVNFFPES